MNTLSEYIIEKLKLDKDIKANIDSDNNYALDVIEIKDLNEIELIKKSLSIGKFLKGKEYRKSLDIYISERKKYMHIFRYSDSHKISISIVIDNSSKWPDMKAWKNGITFNELDDRSGIKELFNSFSEFLLNHIW